MKRIASIQDISCLGRCSLTVALPVIPRASGLQAGDMTLGQSGTITVQRADAAGAQVLKLGSQKLLEARQAAGKQLVFNSFIRACHFEVFLEASNIRARGPQPKRNASRKRPAFPFNLPGNPSASSCGKDGAASQAFCFRSGECARA